MLNLKKLLSLVLILIAMNAACGQKKSNDSEVKMRSGEVNCHFMEDGCANDELTSGGHNGGTGGSGPVAGKYGPSIPDPVDCNQNLERWAECEDKCERPSITCKPRCANVHEEFRKSLRCN